jgi:hypothetical protein
MDYRERYIIFQIRNNCAQNPLSRPSPHVGHDEAFDPTAREAVCFAATACSRPFASSADATDGRVAPLTIVGCNLRRPRRPLRRAPSHIRSLARWRTAAAPTAPAGLDATGAGCRLGGASRPSAVVPPLCPPRRRRRAVRPEVPRGCRSLRRLDQTPGRHWRLAPPPVTGAGRGPARGPGWQGGRCRARLPWGRPPLRGKPGLLPGAGLRRERARRGQALHAAHHHDDDRPADHDDHDDHAAVVPRWDLSGGRRLVSWEFPLLRDQPQLRLLPERRGRHGLRGPHQRELQ